MATAAADQFDWENSKENFQPVRSGRKQDELAASVDTSLTDKERCASSAIAPNISPQVVPTTDRNL